LSLYPEVGAKKEKKGKRKINYSIFSWFAKILSLTLTCIFPFRDCWY